MTYKKDYKNKIKHKWKQLSIDDVINHIQIEEYNKTSDKVEQAHELSPKVNLVEEKQDSDCKTDI